MTMKNLRKKKRKYAKFDILYVGKVLNQLCSQDDEKDEDFHPSSQQTESSSGFQSSQNSNASAEDEIPESVNHRRAVKRVDPEANYIYSSQGSQSSESWSGDNYSDQDEEQEVPSQGTKTPSFLPSSPIRALY